jgi:hypothetical protein
MENRDLFMEVYTWLEDTARDIFIQHSCSVIFGLVIHHFRVFTITCNGTPYFYLFYFAKTLWLCASLLCNGWM